MFILHNWARLAALKHSRVKGIESDWKFVTFRYSIPITSYNLLSTDLNKSVKMQKFFAIALLLVASFSSVIAAPVPIAAPQTDVEDAVKTLPDGTIVPFDA
ncbi:hypothetical protein EYR41_002981 [Orbilia oligospora]|uniref:Uncharacterized protein n=1 Tax=Orbilia oligospora TaxID=2813651 RepID=A0A7C8PTZ2_ORBOL|nr:hypothetical protein TWF751_000427 [Orbilia oligospora]TGJ70975.1 hypothetical protein EYR41_002981 [Orbilia oligospora]